jgi:uncharacterized OB-fold protein
VVAVVALEEGPHLLTNLTGYAPDSVSVGTRMQATFETVAAEIGVVKFTRREAGA